MKLGTLFQMKLNDIPVWGEIKTLGKIHKNDFVIILTSSYKKYGDNRYTKVISKYGICEIDSGFIDVSYR
jgi:hypothetical protein